MEIISKGEGFIDERGPRMSSTLRQPLPSFQPVRLGRWGPSDFVGRMRGLKCARSLLKTVLDGSLPGKEKKIRGSCLVNKNQNRVQRALSVPEIGLITRALISTCL